MPHRKQPETMKTMAQQVDRLLLRWALGGFFALLILAFLPFFYQTYLILSPPSFWLRFTQFYIFVDSEDNVQKVMLGRNVIYPPLEVKFVWKVRDVATETPLCYREIVATFEKSETVAAPLDQFLRTCDRTKWVGKTLILSAHVRQTLDYNIQKEYLLTSEPFRYAGNGKGPNS